MFVPRESGVNTVLSTKGLETGDNFTETSTAVNTHVNNKNVPRGSECHTVLSTKGLTTGDNLKETSTAVNTHKKSLYHV